MAVSIFGCKATNPAIEVYETTSKGGPMQKIEPNESNGNKIEIKLNPNEQFQEIIGFGGSFTQASAHVLNSISKEKRQEVLDAYFSEKGANYSFTRTHMASCDFSLNNYTYAKVPNDVMLEHFSIDEDRSELLPMIQDAKKISKDGFKIIASPWTCPPWMKDNNSWIGGKLLSQYNDAFALYFSKYLKAYKNEGIDIWGITVINEPHGNGNNWESTLFSPEEMTAFVQNHLGPKLEKDGWKDVQILGYDQNRAGLQEWVDVMFRDLKSKNYFDGTAIHWYESTYDYFPEALKYAHEKAPEKYLIQTEACVDSEIPKWKDDNWYWQKEATDWGWDWASEKDRYLHPKYAPVNRYAADIIGCMNNWVNGWIDWNMVLNTQGGPNWFKNWCVAPVIVDEKKDEVYYTPLYYVMTHFSKFIRPGAIRIGFTNPDNEVVMTAAKNKDESIIVIAFNPSENDRVLEIELNKKMYKSYLQSKSIQTIIIKR